MSSSRPPLMTALRVTVTVAVALALALASDTCPASDCTEGARA